MPGVEWFFVVFSVFSFRLIIHFPRSELKLFSDEWPIFDAGIKISKRPLKLVFNLTQFTNK